MGWRLRGSGGAWPSCGPRIWCGACTRRATPAIRDANGHTTALQYNAWDLVERVTAPSPLRYVTNYHYDPSGNLLRMERQSVDAEDPQTTTYAYNVRDWLTSVRDEFGQTTRYGYDPNGNRHTMTDPLGRVTIWTFDERNLLYETRDALGPTTRLFYNPRGFLSEVVDGKNQSTRYAYDSYDRLRITTHADKSTEQRTYDAAGNLASLTTRAGQRLTFSYDTQNKRISKISPVGTTRTSYDLGSRVVRIASPGATLAYAYNARDQLVTETTQPAGRTSAWTVPRSYDGVDNLAKLTYPDGSAYHYVRDALNRITAVQNAAKQNLISYTYNSLSQMTRADRQSGARSLLAGVSTQTRKRIVSFLEQRGQGKRDFDGRCAAAIKDGGKFVNYFLDITAMRDGS